MKYKVLTDRDINYFKELIGNKYVQTNFIDSAESLEFFTDVILQPASSLEISKIVMYCNENLLPIISGASHSEISIANSFLTGGVFLSLHRLNKILEIDDCNFHVKVEPGTMSSYLKKVLAEKNLFYPNDASTVQNTSVGGIISKNIGGEKALKYGNVSHNVLNLEVVLPTGEIIWTSSNTLTNSMGLNITQLFVGSEGSLGIITKAILKVFSIPQKEISLLIPFRDVFQISDAVSAIFKSGLTPSALEFMDQRAIDATLEFLKETRHSISPESQALLLVSFDENIENSLPKLVEIVSNFKIGEIQFGENDFEKSRIWEVRRKVSEVVKENGYNLEQIIVVPRTELAYLVTRIHHLADIHNFKVVCFGHAGEGILNIRINHSEFKKSNQIAQIQKILNELFKIVKDLGGILSEEHRSGLNNRIFIPTVFSEANLNFKKSIKKAIDPKNIMNPKRVFNNF